MTYTFVVNIFVIMVGIFAHVHYDNLAHQDKNDVMVAAYNEKVVAFLRQQNLVEILKEKNDVFRVTASLWAKLKMIRNEGTEALVRLSNDVELIILLR